MPHPTASERLTSVGEQIRARRQHLGWTQEALAERARVTVTTISRIETGAVHPDLPTLAALVDSFSCTFGDLLDVGVGPDSAGEDLEGYLRVMTPEHRELLTSLAKALAKR